MHCVRKFSSSQRLIRTYGDLGFLANGAYPFGTEYKRSRVVYRARITMEFINSSYGLKSAKGLQDGTHQTAGDP